MRILTGLLFLLTVIAGLPTELEAACGGGGWRNKGSKPRVERESREYEAQEVTYKSAPRNSAGHANFDTSRFDASTRELSLSERQWNVISDAKRDIRRKLEELQKAQEKAQSKFDRCDGRCDDERRKLERANDALNEFNPNREFERRLEGVLSERQMEQYLERKGRDIR